MSAATFDLMKMDRKALLAVFRELDAPEINEMDGEFRATLLDQGRWTHNFFTLMAFNLPGVWISKSFSPLNNSTGRGYNSFRLGTHIKKIYRMRTYLAPSRLDGRLSYHLDYGRHNKNNVPSFTKLAGELRKCGDGLFLGIGTADFGISCLRREQPFILEGPVADFDPSVWSDGGRESADGDRPSKARTNPSSTSV